MFGKRSLLTILVWVIPAAVVLTGFTALMTRVPDPDRVDKTRCVSVDPSGAVVDGVGLGSRILGNGCVSADGRYVVFDSAATDLVPGDTNNWEDVFVRDRLAGETVRVNLSWHGSQANFWSNADAISASGRYVLFDSDATNIVPGDTNGVGDLFVNDRETGETTRVTVDSHGNQANGDTGRGSISDDGRYVAFMSSATNLVPGDTNGVWDVFVHDCVTGETTRASVDSSGNEGNGYSNFPAISADGRYVAFASWASNLVSGDANGLTDIFVRDRQTGETTLVSRDSQGNQGNAYSSYPSISADGRYVAFHSYSSNLVPRDTNGVTDVFVHDRVTGETTRVSVSSSGVQGNSFSEYPSISGDGQVVAFQTMASNLAPDDLRGGGIFIHDQRTKETRLASAVFRPLSSPISGSGQSSSAAISRDGRYVAFYSLNPQLVPDDRNETNDVFINGPELTLEADPSEAGRGQRLTLTVFKIESPSREARISASLWAVAVNGTSLLSLVSTGRFASDGNFVVTGRVPAGLSGTTITFRSYGWTGALQATNDVTVSFR